MAGRDPDGRLALPEWLDGLHLTGDSANVWAWSRGYATCPKGQTLVDTEIARLLAEDLAQIEERAAALNGCFSAVFATQDEVVVVTDRFGTVPIYRVLRSGRSTVLSASVRAIRAHLAPGFDLDNGAVLDMLQTGYVVGRRTVLRDVETVPPATVLRFGANGVTEHRTWNYGYRPEDRPDSEVIESLESALRAAASRTANALKRFGVRPFLPVSGGLDSRVLGALFADLELGEILSGSYGPADGDAEMEAGREVAAELGFAFDAFAIGDFLTVEHINAAALDVGLTTRFTCGLGARYVAQEFVYGSIPGHTGDFLSGKHLPPTTALVRTLDDARRFIHYRHYDYGGGSEALQLLIRPEYREQLRRGLNESCNEESFNGDILGSLDRWNVENRQRNLILMELRAYERLGRWVLPFYDYELVDAFSRIPHRLRIGQLAYVKTAVERLFQGRRAGLATIERVGGSIAPDLEAYRRHQRLGSLPLPFRSALLRVLPKLRDLRAKRNAASAPKSGPDPLKWLFHNHAPSREAILRQLRMVELDCIDCVALERQLLDRRTPTNFFHRVIPGLLTVAAITSRG